MTSWTATQRGKIPENVCPMLLMSLDLSRTVMDEFDPSVFVVSPNLKHVNLSDCAAGQAFIYWSVKVASMPTLESTRNSKRPRHR
nr:hypothetical protein BaRGS_013283 [Batillaria attramentaria]